MKQPTQPPKPGQPINQKREMSPLASYVFGEAKKIQQEYVVNLEQQKSGRKWSNEKLNRLLDEIMHEKINQI